MKSPNDYHHGDLRAALLSEAERMIGEGGTDAITMREIGRRLGVSRAAPYRHFSSKDELLVTVAAVGFEKLRARLRAVEAPDDEPVGRFRRMGREYVLFALDSPAHYRLMYGKEAVARGAHPELRAAADRLFDELVELIRAHQRSGALREGDPKAMAYVAWSTVHGLASLIVEGQILAEVDVEALITEAMSTTVRGMRG